MHLLSFTAEIQDIEGAIARLEWVMLCLILENFYLCSVEDDILKSG